MKRPRPNGSMDGPNGLKAFAKDLVHMFSLGPDAARFSVVSFAANATTRVPWSYDASEIDAGIDAISPDGETSISDGFEVARQLLLTTRESLDGRDAAKIVLFLSDGEQTVDAAPDKTELETALAAADAAHAGARIVAAGEKFRPGRRANLANVKVVKSRAVAGQRIDVGRGEVGVAVDAQITPALVVGDEEDDIGAVRTDDGNGQQRGQGKKDCDFSHGKDIRYRRRRSTRWQGRPRLIELSKLVQCFR